MTPTQSMPMNQGMFPGGQMNQQQGSNLLAGLTEKMTKKIFSTVTDNMANQLTQQSLEALQQGVPYGHILDELLKASPMANATNAGMDAGKKMMGGGGNPPPGGPNGNGPGGQPPQQPVVSQDNGMEQPINSGQPQNSNYQNGPNINQAFTGQTQQQPNQQPMQQQVNREQTNGFFDPGGFNSDTNTVRMPGGFMNGWGTNRIKEQQGIMGKQPLQDSDREKIGLETDRELAKSRVSFAKDEKDRQIAFFKSINEPLSSAKDLSLVESALTGIDDISNLLGISSDEKGNVSVANEKLLRDVNFMKKNTQQLKRARDLYINKTLRRDSGAAIGKKEEDDFKKIIGFDIGMGAFMQNPKVIAKAILESKDQLTRDRGRLSPNEKQRSLVSGLRAKNFKDKEIYEYLQRSGEVS